MYLNLVLLCIFFACVALMFNNGLWSNIITLFNTVTAALLATNYFEYVSDKLDKWDHSYTYLWDFLALWGVFVVYLSIFRAITDFVSKVKVRFKKPVDVGGGIFFAVWTAWVMVGFTLMTLHTAPLGRTFLGDAFQPEPESRMFFGMAPDRQWLAFTQGMSNGAYYHGPTAGQPEDGHMFDPSGSFVLRYGQRRATFEEVYERTNAWRVK